MAVPRTSKVPPPVEPPSTIDLSDVSDATDSQRKVPVALPPPKEMVEFLPKELGEPAFPRFKTFNCPAPTVVTPSNVLSLRVINTVPFPLLLSPPTPLIGPARIEFSAVEPAWLTFNSASTWMLLLMVCTKALFAKVNVGLVLAFATNRKVPPV